MEETLGSGLLLSSIFHKRKRNLAVVATNQYSAQRLYEFLLNFFDEEEVVFFPSDELLRAETLASSRELLSQRLYALGKLLDGEKHILVTHPSALLRYLPSKKRFEEESIRISIGDSLDLKELKSRLVSIGYEGINKVEHSLQFASRGDILDVYSVSYANPIRIEFFGDEIESIREFDVSTQESIESRKSVVILPATDIFLNDEELSEFAIKLKERIEKDGKRYGASFKEEEERNCSIDLEDFMEKNYKSALYKYYGFALGESHSVLSYFDPELVYLTNKEQFEESSTNLNFEAHGYLGELHGEALTCSGLEQYMKVDAALKGKKVIFSHDFSPGPGSSIFNVHRISLVGRNFASIVPSIESYLRQNEHVVLALSEAHQRKTVLSLLSDAGIDYEEVENYEIPRKKLGICTLSLSEGFEIPDLKIAYMCSNELFGNRVVNSRFTTRFKEAAVLKSYEDLRPGDYVVHEYNGIGQFIDINTIEVEGVHRDYLHIVYAGNESLYVPLEQFRLVRKYSGREGATPKLSHLSGNDWKKKKESIKKKVSDLADRLLALYGYRAAEGGYEFPPDDDLQRQFEDEFAFTLTHDQEQAVVDIKKDMESKGAMDRLVCGDVGFGKTEVAFRAAFKAINSGKQVALLAPTTLLARQHYEVAESRFATFGIHLGLLSRMVSPAEQKRVIEGLKDGSIDMVIGTHRLFAKSIEYKDLGLLIVDEEQRFGVEQKEKIKEMKQSIDVLTLSATPIPRTLQMSLAGIRPISEINTPPQNRMPIQTYVAPYKESVVDELIQRELARNGQVFYLHNKIASIFSLASRVGARIPKAKIGVVHGQMEKEQIEETMERFYDGEINLLFCTSIIENGIDVPNANMIIVEDADTFGLAQLYQIKGRVGRGNRIAYAYLLYKEKKQMNEDAKKRLKAIQEFTELGSGYKIAQRDLMIRGAGDILGSEQAGFIDSIGLDLYLKLLDEAVQAKRTGVIKEPPKPNKLFQIDAYIPKGYATKGDKIKLYQELDEIENTSKLKSFARKVKDIYGRMPEEVSLLIQKKKIDIIVSTKAFESISEEEDKVDIKLSDSFSRIDGIGNELFQAVIPYLSFIRVGFMDKKLNVSLIKRDGWLDDLEKVVVAIEMTYEKCVKEEK
ncbi:MAG: transcription-repair coupling factor [Bacilli bacterium]|nr:transcription-repair coupling factor [Bacilli bacterium]